MFKQIYDLVQNKQISTTNALDNDLKVSLTEMNNIMNTKIMWSLLKYLKAYQVKKIWDRWSSIDDKETMGLKQDIICVEDIIMQLWKNWENRNKVLQSKEEKENLQKSEK